MKVSLKNTGKDVVNGMFGINALGKLVLEIIAENETERSFFRGCDEYASQINVSVGDEGCLLTIYKRKEDK